MEHKLLKGINDRFYMKPKYSKEEQEVRACHDALIGVLDKPERKLVLRTIDAQDTIKSKMSLDSFIAGFDLARRLTQELNIYEKERSVSHTTVEEQGVQTLQNVEDEA